jgi:type II secretory pathway pseudopilin PulG
MKASKGFILVELIVSLILVGVIGVFTVLFLYTGLNGYLRAQETAEGALKAQVALDRISLELRDIATITDLTDNTSIDYTSDNDELPGARRLIYSPPAGNRLGTISISVDGVENVLVDDLTAFSLTGTYADLNDTADGNNEVAWIDLSFAVSEIKPFSLQIYPRNMIPEPL